MILHDNGLIGKPYSDVSLEFQGMDSIESYKKNLKDTSNNWIFRKKKIVYSYNSIGHRCKDIAQLNFDNYILFAGCSHTEGIGVPLEDSYPFVLSKMLNCDYYNLGLGATGIDILLNNLVVWFSKFDKKPRAVIIQWPDITRSAIGNDSNNLEPIGVWNTKDAVKQFIFYGDTINFFDARHILYQNIIENLIKVPIFYLSILGLRPGPVIPNRITSKIVDQGRDLMHPGIISHLMFAKAIYNNMINTRCLSFYQSIEQKN